MSKDGDSSTGDATSGHEGIPKLSIGQRILTSLPNLERPPKTTPEVPSRRPARGDTATGTDGVAGDVIEPDEVLAPGTDAPVPPGRFRDAFLKPPAPRQQRGAPSGMSKDELTHVIKRLDDRERLLALSSAPLGVVVGLLLTIGAIHYNPPVHVKNHVSTGLILFEGGARVVLSAVVVFAAMTRRRSFVAFALLFLGTSMQFPFALPFWALGIWLIFRVFKWQKELSTLTGGAARSRPERSRPERSRPEPRARGSSDAVARGRAGADARRRARTDRTGARAGGRGAKKQPEPPGPPPSKRYTPPKPVRPRPPVS